MTTIKYKSKLLNYNINLSKYDVIIIGSPIWNDCISSPINEVLDRLELQNKNVTFLLYSASGKASNAIKRINKKFNNAKIHILKELKKNKN